MTKYVSCDLIVDNDTYQPCYIWMDQIIRMKNLRFCFIVWQQFRVELWAKDVSKEWHSKNKWISEDHDTIETQYFFLLLNFSWFSLPPCLLNPSVTFCVNYFTYHGRIWKPIYWPAKAHVRALPLCQSVPHSMFIAKQNLGHFLLWSTASTSSSKAFVTFTPSNR